MSVERAGLLAAARVVRRPEITQLLALLALLGQLAALSDALVRMWESQNRAVQAAAPRTAAEGLRTESSRRRAQLAGVALTRPAPGQAMSNVVRHLPGQSGSHPDRRGGPRR